MSRTYNVKVTGTSELLIHHEDTIYTSEDKFAISRDAIMRCLIDAASTDEVDKSKVRGGISVKESAWDLLVNGQTVSTHGIRDLQLHPDFKDPSFQEQKMAIRKRGVSFFFRRAGKQIRMSPAFKQWELNGCIEVFDDQIAKTALDSLLKTAGEFVGFGFWRPHGLQSGPFGRFEAVLNEMN